MKKINTASLARIALGSAVIAVTSWIYVPSVLPYTLQTLGVFFVLCLLGGRLGSISVLVYVLTGAAGFPVFSGFRGGPGVLIGATGGYIAGFILSALIFRICIYIAGNSLTGRILGSVLGLAGCYAAGSLWYAATVTGSIGAGFLSALGVCVVPFIIPDLIKIALAAALAEVLRRRLGSKLIG